VNVVHSVRIHLNPLFAWVNAHQFALWPGSATKQGGRRNENDEGVFHIACRLGIQ